MHADLPYTLRLTAAKAVADWPHYWPRRPQHATADFAICRDTKCAAVLTENLFQDNVEDVAYLLSEAGKAELTALHVAAITKYVRQCEAE